MKVYYSYNFAKEHESMKGESWLGYVALGIVFFTFITFVLTQA